MLIDPLINSRLTSSFFNVKVAPDLPAICLLKRPNAQPLRPNVPAAPHGAKIECETVSFSKGRV